MKLGFSACNYPHRSLYENLDYARAHGFDFVEAYGPAVDHLLASGEGDILAARIEKTVPITIHHALPDPANAEKVARFRSAMDAVCAWVKKHPALVLVLSFDTWVKRPESLDNLLYVLCLFRDVPLPVATEDYPLNAADARVWEAAMAYPNYRLLSDLGHTNVRLSDTGDQPIWCLYNEGENLPLPAGNNSPEAFRNSLKRKPLPIVELHVHNNSGQKDEHRALSDGTADYAGIVPILKELGYDGLVTLECSPTIHDCKGEKADEWLHADAALWRRLWS